MAYQSRNLFTEKKTTKLLTAILYEERLNPNFVNILNDSGYKWYTSPLHTPDGQETKPHRHLILQGKDNNNLPFAPVMELLSKLNPNPATPLCITGGHIGLVKVARYSLHLTADSQSKEQFDLTDPDYAGIDLPDDGIVNGKLNIYHPDKGFQEGNGFDVQNLIKITVRERNEMNASKLEHDRNEILKYVFENHIRNFAALARWCMDHDYIKAFRADSYMLHGIVISMSEYDAELTKESERKGILEERQAREEAAIEEHREITRRKVIIWSFLSQVSADLKGYYSTIDPKNFNQGVNTLIDDYVSENFDLLYEEWDFLDYDHDDTLKNKPDFNYYRSAFREYYIKEQVKGRVLSSLHKKSIQELEAEYIERQQSKNTCN